MSDKQTTSKESRNLELAGNPAGSLWRTPEMSLYSPSGLLHRFAGEMEDLFGDFGSRKIQPWHNHGFSTDLGSAWPQIDILEKNGELVVRADVPGLKKEDLHVEVSADRLSIAGERKDERQEQKGQYYRAERTYGRFERRIPLPEGANPDDVSCTFENGILEIRMKVPQQEVKSSRKIEIQEKSSSEKPGRTA